MLQSADILLYKVIKNNNKQKVFSAILVCTFQGAKNQPKTTNKNLLHLNLKSELFKKREIIKKEEKYFENSSFKKSLKLKMFMTWIRIRIHFFFQFGSRIRISIKVKWI